jgi:hypothetical protein
MTNTILLKTTSRKLFSEDLQSQIVMLQEIHVLSFENTIFASNNSELLVDYLLIIIMWHLQVLDMLEDACQSLLENILAENKHIQES